ncbi:MAG: pyridoxamine 5'-phosphate oxidase family protein [candidate division Zixibacteria bacterium]|nr:pyridoxamine 5'-phosphate oxidase family protein [candidate division Zixibacteria bacterium]
MRRKEREITSIDEIEEVIGRCSICRLAFCDDDIPYIVPVNFGYKDRVLYFHSAPEGRKIDIIRKNNNICIEFDIDTELIFDDIPCKNSIKYRSVIATGKAYLIEDYDSKVKGYDILMKHYKEGPFEYDRKQVDRSIFIKVEIDTMTGKKSGY